MVHPDYILARGAKGRERLRILARVVRGGTVPLLDMAGIPEGAACLDVGCGGGDVSLMLARRAGPAGRVVGIDQDASVVAIATDEAAPEGFDHLSFRTQSVFDLEPDESFDVLYCRFVLTHLPEKERGLQCMLGAVKPGGLLIFEDIDFSGHFCLPERPAMNDYMRLYVETARRNGGDAFFGQKLPMFLKDGGLADLHTRISQPAALDGEVKVINALTMEGVGPRAVAAGLTTEDEVKRIADDLYDAAADPTVFMSIVRIVQAWGRKPA
jgi:SAM-dependent methyltransferase